MNAAIRGFVRAGLAQGHSMWGIARGFEGLIKGQPTALQAATVGNILMSGGTILKTSRFLDFHDPLIRQTAREALLQWDIDGLAVLGGNGSLAGALALSEQGIPVVGIPASIDNDIAGTDYSIGFDTAVNNIVASIDKIRDTASSHERIFVVQVMGNRSGNLAIAAGLACGAEAIIIPEARTHYAAIVDRLEETYQRGKKHSFIVVAEGAGDARKVARTLQQRSGREAKWVVLGHTQRGGPPSARDRIIAAQFGAHAITLLSSGRSGTMVAAQGDKIGELPLSDAVTGRKATPLDVKWLAEMLAR